MVNEETKRFGVLAVLGVAWVVSVILLLAPGLGLATPVFPRPQPNYTLISMLVSGAILAVYSLKTGIVYLRQK